MGGRVAGTHSDGLAGYSQTPKEMRGRDQRVRNPSADKQDENSAERGPELGGDILRVSDDRDHLDRTIVEYPKRTLPSGVGVKRQVPPRMIQRGRCASDLFAQHNRGRTWDGVESIG